MGIEIEFLDDQPRTNGNVDYKYRVYVSSQQQPIDLWITNVSDYLDEDGYHRIDHGPLLHAYEPTFVFAQEFLDLASDAIVDDLKEIYRYR